MKNAADHDNNLKTGNRRAPRKPVHDKGPKQRAMAKKRQMIVQKKKAPESEKKKYLNPPDPEKLRHSPGKTGPMHDPTIQ